MIVLEEIVTGTGTEGAAVVEIVMGTVTEVPNPGTVVGTKQITLHRQPFIYSSIHFIPNNPSCLCGCLGIE